MLYREAGQFKTSYQDDSAIFPIPQDRYGLMAILAVAFLLFRPEGLFGEKIIRRI